MNHLIDFDALPWIETAVGVRYKRMAYENQQLRLVEFSYGFIEPDWCAKGHAGYLIGGSFSIDYAGAIERYKAGDVIFIPKGEQDKHKAILDIGEKATLLLFELQND
jgi:quercetin dioxygenase-like cupin family protein